MCSHPSLSLRGRGLANAPKKGLQAARKRGRVGERPCVTTDQKTEVRRMRDEKGRSIAKIARLFKVSETTVRRA